MIKLFTEEEYKNAKSRQLLSLQCLSCGEKFLKTKHTLQNLTEGNTHEFCSTKCQMFFQCPPIFVICTQCGKSFKKAAQQIKLSKNHFCNHSCAATYGNAHKTKGTRVSKLEVWLQEQLTITYPLTDIHFNRKDAINGELDIYIPSLKLAFELNGIFHYEPIYGKDKLGSIQNNDNRKMQACLENGIELCIIDVSSMSYFKPSKAEKYYDIVRKIIDQKYNRKNPI